MTDSINYRHNRNVPYPSEGRREVMMRKDSSTSVLLTREQQLREDIARLRKEEQELCEKDNWVKQNIVVIREKIAAGAYY
ncbi:hypothetical protein EDC96DRAFT_520017 [Choanephora cucurbitarum]|uniref:Uncharacterized protein n=1 Tax=Choanephora cucurbitarum TaxID=101091 RepID=A0A1C7NBE1_9FUNG|nr:hypothetical protein EDC96DRAFT_520017 [Choanephora cucurbitarum]OBZ86310.1 hypothetical protein A0J61_05640 [Choanephora cucurbitarum]